MLAPMMMGRKKANVTSFFRLVLFPPCLCWSDSEGLVRKHHDARNFPDLAPRRFCYRSHLEQFRVTLRYPRLDIGLKSLGLVEKVLCVGTRYDAFRVVGHLVSLPPAAVQVVGRGTNGATHRKL